MKFGHKIGMALFQLMTALTLACVNTVAATAQQASQPSPIGDWRLAAIYDKFEDGHLRSTWGDKPQGLLQVSVGGFMSLQVFGGDRPKAETVPTDPVGPVRCSYGTCRQDIEICRSARHLSAIHRRDPESQNRGTHPHYIEVLSGADTRSERRRLHAAPGVRTPSIRAG